MVEQKNRICSDKEEIASLYLITEKIQLDEQEVVNSLNKEKSIFFVTIPSLLILVFLTATNSSTIEYTPIPLLGMWFVSVLLMYLPTKYRFLADIQRSKFVERLREKNLQVYNSINSADGGLQKYAYIQKAIDEVREMYEEQEKLKAFSSDMVQDIEFESSLP